MEELLLDWLEELLYVFEVEGLLFREVAAEVTQVAEGEDPAEDATPAWRLVATARGEPRDLDRHPHKVLVKAVTWHGLHVTPGAPRGGSGGWTGRVIFDI